MACDDLTLLDNGKGDDKSNVAGCTQQGVGCVGNVAPQDEEAKEAVDASETASSCYEDLIQGDMQVLESEVTLSSDVLHMVAKSASGPSGPQVVVGPALDGGIAAAAAAVGKAVGRDGEETVDATRRHATWCFGHQPASSSSGAPVGLGFHPASGISLEESLVVLEQQLHMLEDMLEARLSNVVPPGEDGQCFASCQELGSRLQEVSATALECGCSRQVPGAMDVFEQANAMVERVGHLLQHCAPKGEPIRHISFDMKRDDAAMPAKQGHSRTLGSGDSAGGTDIDTTPSASDSRSEGGFIGGLAKVGLSTAELFMSLLGALVHSCCEWVLHKEQGRNR